MVEIALWLSAGVGRGVGNEPRATKGGVVLVPSTCCTAGPELEKESWIGSAVPEVLEVPAESCIAFWVTTSSELVTGGGLTEAGRCEVMGG